MIITLKIDPLMITKMGFWSRQKLILSCLQKRDLDHTMIMVKSNKKFSILQFYFFDQNYFYLRDYLWKYYVKIRQCFICRIFNLFNGSCTPCAPPFKNEISHNWLNIFASRNYGFVFKGLEKISQRDLIYISFNSTTIKKIKS